MNNEVATLMARSNSEKGTLPLFYCLLISQIPSLTSDRPSTFALLKMTQSKTSDFASNSSLGKKERRKKQNLTEQKSVPINSEYRLIFCVINITKRKPIGLIC